MHELDISDNTSTIKTKDSNYTRMNFKRFNFLNLITSLSNIVCLYPLKLSYDNNDNLTFYTLLFLFIASFVSHLIENHKHGMGDPYVSQNISYVLNRVDNVAAVMFAIRMIPIVLKVQYQIDRSDIVLTMITCCLGWISESEQTLKTRTRYIICHSLWHIGAFLMINQILLIYYYGY